MHQKAIILDFGGQYTQLIARKIREVGVFSEILPYNVPIDKIVSLDPIALVLSGGARSVYDKDAPTVSQEIFKLNIPILGICYGMQLIVHLLGGEVKEGRREYGRSFVNFVSRSPLFENLRSREQVWMSHGDEVIRLPKGFRVTAVTEERNVIAAIENGNIFGVQFHPEVTHTPSGVDILRNFLYKVAKARGDWSIGQIIEDISTGIKRKVTQGKVICALSGGVDSTVTAVLLNKVLGKDSFIGLLVDTGFMRKGEVKEVAKNLTSLGVPLKIIDAKDRFLKALKGVIDPEKKRKIIGKTFISVFKEAAEKITDVRYLAQGTLYPDVIESTSVKGPSAVIKTHHNVGGLPEKLDFELVEPFRMLFKDEVRKIGKELKIPNELLYRHPFPGPGLAVRILGEVTYERLRKVREADFIFVKELKKTNLYDKISQALCVLIPVKSVGVVGDKRIYDEVIALRAVSTLDFMTADWCDLPKELLDKVARRIVNEVKGVSRVVYDITSKPPATIEWE